MTTTSEAWTPPEAEPAAAAAAPISPADVTEAARLVSFGLQAKLLPARDAEYGELVRRYREDPPFGRLADAVATGMGLVVLEVSARAGMAVAAAEESVFAVRMGDYARRAATSPPTASCTASRTSRWPRWPSPAPRTSPTTATSAGSPSTAWTPSSGRRAAGWRSAPRPRAPTPTRPATPPAWRPPGGSGPPLRDRRHQGRPPAVRLHHRHRLQGGVLPVDSGFLQKTSDDSGGTYRTTARYQLQVRDLAGSAAMAELLDLGVVPVGDGTPTLAPPDESDELVADAGLPFHAL